ncbi:MAG: phenylalanyl-tRNA synthetase, beta subunit, partial [Dehalococcoidia bacterium]|nr:phenylalanyl-tRNA synthetase, beta subunit [Dehalococcoidia bacterium]
PEEREMLCAVLSGRRSGSGRWLEGDDNMDFFDLKAVAGAVLTGLGIAESELKPAADAIFQPASSAQLCTDGTPLGVLGEVDRRVASSFEVGGQAYLLELDLEKLLPFTTRLKKFSPMSRFPGMARDIALEIDKGVPARRVQDIIASFPLVSGVTAFDCYTGTGVPPGKKSLAFNIVYLSPERTLTEEEVNSIQDRILARLAQEVGAKLRGA